jgi:hypothetical protein
MTRQLILWPQDPWGRVLNGAMKRSELRAEIVDISQTAVDLALERFEDALHSVYLSGNMARDVGQEAKYIVVLRYTRTAIGLDLFCAAAALRVQKLHPELGSCTFEVYGWDDIFPADGRFSHPRFRLGVNSVAMAGRDLKRLIAPQKLTSAAANASIVGLSGKLRAMMHRLKAVSTEARVRATSQQFAQISINGAFASIMVTEQVYTEDLETMATYISLGLPERRQLLLSLVKLAQEGTSSSLEALSISEQVLSWLPDLADEWLDQNNPERDAALRLV